MKTRTSMWNFILSFIILQLIRENNAVTRPPGVYIQAKKDVFYKAHETVQLQCVADGMPKPEYTWTKDGRPFSPSGNDNRMVQLPDAGTIVVNDPESKDEGIYQCTADNGFGKSTTININFREAKLKEFKFEDDKHRSVQLGDSLTLNCVPPESIPPPDVYWVIKETYGGFTPINFDSRVSMDHESRLRFTNVKASDHQDGKAYACMAMNDIVRKNTQGRRYFVTTRGATEDQRTVSYLWASPSDHFGLKDSTFRVKCIFAGNPTPDVHWGRPNGEPLPDHVKFTSFGQELVFNGLKFSDAGKYECWATNTLTPTRVSRTITLRVEAKPYWIEEPKDVEIGIGGKAVFHCLGAGKPDPEMYWFINGVPLKDVVDPRINERFKRVGTNMVTFENVTKDDAMVIQCNITNKHGSVWGDVYLNVLSEAPTILDPPKPVVVTAEGQSVKLRCGTTGKPDPQITWIKEGQQITGGRYHTLITGDLLIENVVLSDAGHFVCEAENRYDKVSANGTLMVRRKTRLEQTPKDLEAGAGADIKFTCSGTTDPEEVHNLKIKWMKDGKDITDNDQRMTPNKQDNSLTVSGTIVRDSGTYTCIATNGLDEAKASAMLTVKDRPDAPVSVKIEACEKGNATVRWIPGSYNNAPVQYFIIQYNTTFNPDQWIHGAKVDTQKTVANVTLSPYANYTFRVLAYNKIGRSDPSFPSKTVCKTQEARPTNHPENLRTIGNRKGYLNIEWTPMPRIQQNGPGFEYLLHIKRQGDADTSTKPIQILDWKQNHYEQSTGDVYTAYEITLKARNTVGEAKTDPVTIIGYSGEDIPTIAPSDLTVVSTDATTADLSWNFDMSAIGRPNTPLRGEFKGFKIQLWRQGLRVSTMREWDVSRKQAESGAVGNLIRARVEDLLPFTYVEARVSVMNNFYVSRPTDVIRFQTKEGVPGPVGFFKARNIGDNHFNLEWGTPMDENGYILGYDIAYQTVKGLDLGKMQDREPQINNKYQTSEMLSGLLPNTKYRVYIWARTSQGRGESYFIELKTTKPGNPEAPRYTIADVGEHFINVTWWVNPYARSGTVIFVEYRKEGAPEWQRTTDEVFYTWKNITDLESGTSYEVRVIATNSKKRTVSGVEQVTTHGIAAAIALVGNIGWFIGMLLALLLMIGLGILFYFCYKRGFKFGKHSDNNYRNNATYTGTNTSRIPEKAPEFAPEPRGYSNDYYDERDSYYDYDHDSMRRSTNSLNTSIDKRPPSYSDHDRYSGHYDDGGEPDPYEDYDHRDSRPYDPEPEYDHREPDKFDREGYPRTVQVPPQSGGAMSSFV